jgi:hypothetical protein
MVKMKQPLKEGLVGAPDLIDPYSTLAIRRGLLLRAMTGSAADGKAKAVSRTLSDATKLGLQIYENFGAYAEEIESSVRSSLEANGLKCDEFEIHSRDWMRSKYAPGLILDFPRFKFGLGPYKVTGRCCVTICFADSVSKIWSRLVLEDQQQLLVGNNPKVARYFHIGSEMCSDLNEKVQGLYLADFQASIGRQSERHTWFEKVGSLDYFGLDEEPELIRIVTSIVEGQSMVDDDQISTLKEHLAFLARASGVPAGEGRSERLARVLKRLHPYTGEEGQQALFAADVQDSSASFFLASARLDPFDAEQQERLGRARNSSALDSIQELATMLATKF